MDCWELEPSSFFFFSDESTLGQFVSHVSHVRRPKGKGFHDKYIVSTVRHPQSWIIWGSNVKIRHCFIVPFFPQKCTSVTDPCYVEMLQDSPLTHMTEHRCIIFMHDGAPCYRSKAVETIWRGAILLCLTGQVTVPTSTLQRISGPF